MLSYYQDMFKDGESVAIKILHLKYAMLGNQETHCLACLNRADPYDFSGTLRILVCQFRFHTSLKREHYCFRLLWNAGTQLSMTALLV